MPNDNHKNYSKNIHASTPSILDHIPSAIYIKDLDGRYLYVNRTYEELLNVKRSEVYGQKDIDILPGSIADLSRSLDKKVIEAESPLTIDDELLLEDGLHNYHSTKFPLYDDSGVLYGMCNFSTEITSLLQTEEALFESEEKFMAIFNNTYQLIGLLTVDGILLEANNTSLKMIGARPSDVLGKYFWDTPWWNHSEEIRQQLRRGIEKAVRGEAVRFETIHPDINGVPNYFDFSITPIRDASGNIKFLIPEGRNITDLKLAKLRGSEIEAKYQALFNMSSTPMLLFENERIVECNRAALNILGHLDARDIIGKTALDISPDYQPDGTESYLLIKKQFNDAYRDGACRFEWYYRTKNGVSIPMDVCFTHMPDNKTRVLHAIWTDIRLHKKAQEEIKSLNQELLSQVDTQNEALKQSREMIDDATEKLTISEQKAYLSELLPGISHEINTPMGVSVTTASYLKKTVAHTMKKFQENQLTKSDFLDFLEDVELASSTVLSNLNRASDLIFSIKDIATDQISESKRLFNLRKYLDEILLSLHNAIKKTPHKISILCPDALNISSYPGIYSQIFTNFIMNSLDHGFRDDKQGEIQIHVDVKGPMLFIEYRDNGAGMDEETLSHVFEPFFTTKRAEGNSGLGMHIVYDLVTERLKGTIRAVSRVNEGVQFFLEIPLDTSKDHTH